MDLFAMTSSNTAELIRSQIKIDPAVDPYISIHFQDGEVYGTINAPDHVPFGFTVNLATMKPDHYVVFKIDGAEMTEELAYGGTDLMEAMSQAHLGWLQTVSAVNAKCGQCEHRELCAALSSLAAIIP